MEVTGCSVNRNMDDIPYSFVITTGMMSTILFSQSDTLDYTAETAVKTLFGKKCLNNWIVSTEDYDPQLKPRYLVFLSDNDFEPEK